MPKRTENSGDESRIDIACFHIAIGCTEQSWENYAECNSDWNCRMQCQGKREFDIAPCATHQSIDAASVRLRGDSWSGNLKKKTPTRDASTKHRRTWVFIKIVALNQAQLRIGRLEEDPPNVAE